MKNIVYSIVIPVYKTTGTLREVAMRIKKVFTTMDKNYELIFVNDSPSSQATDEVLQLLAKEDPNVVYICLTKNFGQQVATLCGFKYAKGDYIITMDDDLQHQPEDISTLVRQQDHDFVVGKFIDTKHSFTDRLTSKIKNYFDYILLGRPKGIQLTSYRLMKSQIAQYMLESETPYPFIPALMFSVSMDIVNVPISHSSRQENKSNYTFTKRFRVFSNMLINNSSFLLKSIGRFGLFTFSASFVYGMILVFRKFFYSSMLTGWTSITLLILFFGGTNLFALGIIGEYLLRSIQTSERKPMYHVKEIMRGKDD